MPTAIIKLAKAAQAASADNIATFDVPEDGVITGVQWSITGTTGFQSADSLRIELSFLSTSQFNSNDSRGAISEAGVSASTLTTNGLMGPFTNVWVGPMEVEVQGGERIFLHSLLTGVAGADIACLIHILTRRTPPRRARRRR